MNPTAIVTLVGIGISFIVTVIGATVKIVNSEEKTRRELSGQISTISTEIAVMKEREKNRDEKIDQVHNWFMEVIKNGWTEHMKNLSRIER